MEKRLQSLKLPRDLTLGGTKNKKAYVPNLNAVRNKEKSKPFTKKDVVVKKERTKHERKFDNTQQNGRYIQSSSVFSEGAAKENITKRFGHDKYNNEDSRVSMSMPTVKKSDNEVNKTNEIKVFEDIMKQGFESDDDEKMPFMPIAWNENDLKGKSDVGATEFKREIKAENGTENIEPTLKKLKIENPSNKLPYEYEYIEELSDHRPLLTLWNLPVSFSAKGFTEDSNKIIDYKLKDMLEGQIGKLVVRKSGLVELYVGNMKYNLESSRTSNEPNFCTEEIVHLEQKSDENISAAVLGDIKNNFMVIPDWNYLLN